MGTTKHTVDEALAKFDLIANSTGGEAEGKACAMSMLSWVAGEAWSDHPPCAHRLLADMAIKANDAYDTTPEQREAIVRAGCEGIIGTWWVPTEVILLALSEAPADRCVVDRALAVFAAVAAWKAAEPKARADLRIANLRSADLYGANLRSADLRGADLRGADLRGADLRIADLRGANLRIADLRGADLRIADLRGADLSGADLSGANLYGAHLRFADLYSANLYGAHLRFADLSGANLYGARGNAFTKLPDGWVVQESTGLVMLATEAKAAG